jgi:hypothetical protein
MFRSGLQSNATHPQPVALCETENVDAIVIAADVEDPDVVEAQRRRITIKLKGVTLPPTNKRRLSIQG